MGIINIVKNTKELYPKYVTIVKVGSFYYCYGRDCYIMVYLLRYKINILKDNIYSCAFPQNAISKVMATLEQNKINYLVLDRRNNYDLEEKSNNGNLNKYDEKYEIAKKHIATKMRVEKINQYLMDNLKDKELIDKIEKVINERRKIQSN